MLGVTDGMASKIARMRIYFKDFTARQLNDVTSLLLPLDFEEPPFVSGPLFVAHPICLIIYSRPSMPRIKDYYK